jgi:hypothetical protein
MGEFLIDTAVALALIAGGTTLLGVVVYDFVRALGHEPVVGRVLGLLERPAPGVHLHRVRQHDPRRHRSPEGGCRAVPDRRDGGSDRAPDRDQRRG